MQRAIVKARTEIRACVAYRKKGESTTSTAREGASSSLFLATTIVLVHYEPAMTVVDDYQSSDILGGKSPVGPGRVERGDFGSKGRWRTGTRRGGRGGARLCTRMRDASLQKASVYSLAFLVLDRHL